LCHTEYRVLLSLINILFRTKTNDSVHVHLGTNDQTFEVDKHNENNDEDVMTVEVLGNMPKVVNFDNELTIQVCFSSSPCKLQF